MTPLDRLRIEKAASDCGFEMMPVDRDDSLELHSARFPESIVVRSAGAAVFHVVASNPLLMGATPGVTAVGYEALYDVLRTAAAHARTLPNRVADAFRRETADLPRSTEAERIVVQRVGQNLFRAALLDYWQGRCCVSGLAIPGLLRASHIKPWAACGNDDERLDVFNGLLLAPHIDALFDGGWISFTDDGRVMMSPALSGEARVQLGASDAWRVHPVNSAHLSYLSFHREHEFRSANL